MIYDAALLRWGPPSEPMELERATLCHAVGDGPVGEFHFGGAACEVEGFKPGDAMWVNMTWDGGSLQIRLFRTRDEAMAAH